MKVLRDVLVVLYAILSVEVGFYVYLTLTDVHNIYMLVAGVEMVIQILVTMAITWQYWRIKDGLK